MTNEQREKLIDALTEHEINDIKDCFSYDDEEYLDSILRFGHKGFNNFTDKELRDECKELEIDTGIADNIANTRTKRHKED